MDNQNLPLRPPGFDYAVSPGSEMRGSHLIIYRPNFSGTFKDYPGWLYMKGQLLVRDGDIVYTRRSKNALILDIKDHLHTLDVLLTGVHGAAARMAFDNLSHALIENLCIGAEQMLYLSDGGWSRIYFQEAGSFSLGSESTKAVKDRWEHWDLVRVIRGALGELMRQLYTELEFESLISQPPQAR